MVSERVDPPTTTMEDDAIAESYIRMQGVLCELADQLRQINARSAADFSEINHVIPTKGHSPATGEDTSHGDLLSYFDCRQEVETESLAKNEKQHMSGNEDKPVPYVDAVAGGEVQEPFDRDVEWGDEKVQDLLLLDVTSPSMGLATEQSVQKGSDEDVEAGLEDDDVNRSAKSSIHHKLCKTLIAFDMSTHRGFFVPRRAADDCFPPLDYNQQRHSQEHIAKDLRGLEWPFMHIHRGQPRRHLLTTGWSAFGNMKKLDPGDVVLFLKASNGDLRLGFRRAAQVKGFSVFPSESIRHLNQRAVLDVPKAISVGSVFNVYYGPRANSSEFVVPYRKIFKSLDYTMAPGTRFKMRFDADDPLFPLYTSSNTRKPKGVLHTKGGYVVYTATTFKYAFDYKSLDIYCCTACCGWITGHNYVTYGPVLNGASVLVFEGAPNYSDSGQCWNIVDKYKLAIFYTMRFTYEGRAKLLPGSTEIKREGIGVHATAM